MSSSLFVKLFHIIIVGGLFFYVGIKRSEIHPFMFYGLFALGAIIILYHLYKAFVRIQHKNPYWVNLIHIFFIGPLLIYIGYNGERTERLYFELLLMSCFAVIGYHGFYLAHDVL